MDRARYVPFLVSAVLGIACRSQGAFRTSIPIGVDRAIATRVDSTVRLLVAQRGVPGASIAVLRSDTIVFAKGYGVADASRGDSVTPGTIFQIASLTKPFTAMAVLILVDAGKIELDAPVSLYLAWLPTDFRSVTVRQLMNHTGGIPRDTRLQDVDEFSFDEFRRRIDTMHLEFTPGQKWSYSNTGYSLLSAIIEQASRMSLGEFFERRIFGPLQMTNTSYRVAATHDGRHAVGYDVVDGTLRPSPHVFSGWGNSGIETTVLDLARWGIALENKRLLSATSYAAWLESARLASGDVAEFPVSGVASQYSLGWYKTTYRGLPLITHGGTIVGFSSTFDRYPEQQLTIIVLSNGKSGNDRIAHAALLGRAVARTLTTMPAPERR